VQEFTDPNARMYQMYFDSSSDPAQNVLQVRKFSGQLHMPEIEDIFGDINSLPRDENCNISGGPVLDDGLIWYLTATPDLVGVNLVSLDPDGSMSSALDLDGDRVVDILDIGLIDNRRFTILSELNGLDVSKLWLQGQNPFCSTEMVEQLGLPNLGCNEAGEGSSGGYGGVNGGWGGIVNPMDMLCSNYESNPLAGLMGNVIKGQELYRLPRAGEGIHRTSILPEDVWYTPTHSRHEQTYVTEHLVGGQWVLDEVTKVIIDKDYSSYPPRIDQIVQESVTPNGSGTRVIQRFNPDGTLAEPEIEHFYVNEDDLQRDKNYEPEGTGGTRLDPPPDGSTKTNPGPDGDDANVAAFCERRANYRSGLEQAADEDPTSMSVSCNDIVGDPDMPDDPNCTITQWARPEDFLGFLEPPSEEDGCDPFEDPDQMCEPTTVKDRIRRFRGRTADLWSIGLPNLNLCPPFACDPANAAEQRSYTAGEVDLACEVVIAAPTLEPSAENCPPGTYYAPMTNRCIEIDLTKRKNSEGAGDGGPGGGCNLSAGACSSQGYSFDSGSCSCVPIQ